MTPKEKALELFETYLTELVKYDFDTNNKYNQPYNEIAKQCALIAVEFSKEFITGDLSEAFDKFLYIQEVKEEIEKL
jgi:hypothetical protein